MDHQQAETTHAVERYVLNEMTSAEREQFEEHYFDCPECAGAVRTAVIFSANAHAEVKEKKTRPTEPGKVDAVPIRPMQFRRKGWINFVPAIAASLLVAFTGYENLVTIPHLRKTTEELSQPRALNPIAMRPRSRGQVPAIRVTDHKPILLELEINSSLAVPSYSIDVKNKAGAVLYRIPNAAARDGVIAIEIPPEALSPGFYELQVNGPSDGAGIFDVQLEK